MPCYLPFFDSKGHAPSLVHILQITNYRDMQLTSVSIYQYRSSYNIKHRPVGNFTKNESFRAYYRSSPRESSLKRITRIVPQNLQKAKQLTATTSTSKTAMSQTVVDNRMRYAIQCCLQTDATTPYIVAPHNVGSCCVHVRSGVQMDATTPNNVGTRSASWEGYSP